jgi:hypothetical protein
LEDLENEVCPEDSEELSKFQTPRPVKRGLAALMRQESSATIRSHIATARQTASDQKTRRKRTPKKKKSPAKQKSNAKKTTTAPEPVPAPVPEPAPAPEQEPGSEQDHPEALPIPAEMPADLLPQAARKGRLSYTVCLENEQGQSAHVEAGDPPDQEPKTSPVSSACSQKQLLHCLRFFSSRKASTSRRRNT